MVTTPFGRRVTKNGSGRRGLRVWNGYTVCYCFPCFRENVVVTCKIGLFLCSLDNLLQKNVIVFFFGNQISKWRSFENKCQIGAHLKKRAVFDLLFTFFSHQGKVYTKNPTVHISLTYIHFAHPIDFLPYQF